eukprot:TRINITY_DN5115_c5_g1_i1.p1 TRINITY_DN5115_c5_g1~~TRINITY_DN5115_c5_g1_i1.p1  ORF type:complete len:184 (+),score=39.99 TRINITY_DN5115_c5_g1_i1:204-755(+)
MLLPGQLNGFAAVRFGGQYSSFTIQGSLPLSASSGFTIFVVGKYNKDLSNGYYGMIFGACGGTVNNQFVWYTENTVLTYPITQMEAFTVGPTTDYHLLAYRVSGGMATVTYNGAASPNGPKPASGDYRLDYIANYCEQAPWPAALDLVEVAVYGTSMTDCALKDTQDYLCSRYALDCTPATGC